MKWTILLILLLGFAVTAQADELAQLQIRLDEIIDDADDRKMSVANKLIFLNSIGWEYGRRGFFVKRDTILTTANTETYALNDDCAGAVQSAYLKRGQTRRSLPVVSRDSTFRAPPQSPGYIAYVYVDKDGRMGTEAIPLREDTVILIYFSYPDTLAAADDEWDLPDHYEGPALLEAAADILRKIPTAWAEQKSATCAAAAAAKLVELRDPPTDSRQVGITFR